MQSAWHSNNTGGQTSAITFIRLRFLKEAFQIHYIIISYLFYWGPIDSSTPIYSQPISFINKVELTSALYVIQDYTRWKGMF